MSSRTSRRRLAVVDIVLWITPWIFSVRVRMNIGLSSIVSFRGLVDYFPLFYRRVSDIISALSTRVSSLSLVN